MKLILKLLFWKILQFLKFTNPLLASSKFFHSTSFIGVYNVCCNKFIVYRLEIFQCLINSINKLYQILCNIHRRKHEICTCSNIEIWVRLWIKRFLAKVAWILLYNYDSLHRWWVNTSGVVYYCYWTLYRQFSVNVFTAIQTNVPGVPVQSRSSFFIFAH